jgi:hypothetical protein
MSPEGHESQLDFERALVAIRPYPDPYLLELRELTERLLKETANEVA